MDHGLLTALLIAATSPLAEPPPPPAPSRDRRGPETLPPPEGVNPHGGADFGSRSSEITFVHKARWTEDREEKLAKAAAKRMRRQAKRLAEGRHL